MAASLCALRRTCLLSVSCCVVSRLHTPPSRLRLPPRAGNLPHSPGLTHSLPAGPKQPLTTYVECAPHLSRRSTPPQPLKPKISRSSFFLGIHHHLSRHPWPRPCLLVARAFMDVSKANASGRARSKKGAALGETSTNARSPTRSEVCGIVTQSCRSGYSGPDLHCTQGPPPPAP